MSITSPSIAEVLAGRPNDYRTEVAAFQARTGLPWHAPTPPTLGGGPVSVVIPAHNAGYSLPTALDALAGQATSATVEVIVVDDGSTDDTPVIAARHPAVTRAVRLPRPHGAGAARNAGVHLATGQTVVFLDADMVLPPHVLADFAARATPGLILIGFRHDIEYRPAAHGRAEVPAGEPRLLADHRVRWRSPVGTPSFHSGRTYHRPTVVWTLDETDDLVGLGHGAEHHGWDLPLMVVTALMAAPREAVVTAGGFHTTFDAGGWGSEDTHLGALLIAAGHRVAPLRQARGWHIDPPDATAVRKWKMLSATERTRRCRALLDQPPPGPEGRERFTAATADLLAQTEPLR